MPKKRGLAGMPFEKRREIALMGMQKLREKGMQHKFTSQSGKAAVNTREAKREVNKAGENIIIPITHADL